MNSQQLKEAHVLIFSYFMLAVNMPSATTNKKGGSKNFGPPFFILKTIVYALGQSFVCSALPSFNLRADNTKLNVIGVLSFTANPSLYWMI